MLHNPCCSSFRNVVSWKLETFYFSFQHFYMPPFYESVLGPALSFVLNSLLSMGIFLWLHSVNPRDCHHLQPKSPFAEMMAASLWKLLSFYSTGNTPALNTGRHSFVPMLPCCRPLKIPLFFCLEGLILCSLLKTCSLDLMLEVQMIVLSLFFQVSRHNYVLHRKIRLNTIAPSQRGTWDVSVWMAWPGPGMAS